MSHSVLFIHECTHLAMQTEALVQTALLRLRLARAEVLTLPLLLPLAQDGWGIEYMSNMFVCFL